MRIKYGTKIDRSVRTIWALDNGDVVGNDGRRNRGQAKVSLTLHPADYQSMPAEVRAEIRKRLDLADQTHPEPAAGWRGVLARHGRVSVYDDIAGIIDRDGRCDACGHRAYEVDDDPTTMEEDAAMRREETEAQARNEGLRWHEQFASGYDEYVNRCLEQKRILRAAEADDRPVDWRSNAPDEADDREPSCEPLGLRKQNDEYVNRCLEQKRILRAARPR